jgi:mRNA interferase MazF
MKRGDLYRVRKGNPDDPRPSRVFVVASRQVLIDSGFSTVTCAPVYSRYDGLSTQVEVGVEEGLKRECAIHCDELLSIPKARLTDFVGSLGDGKMGAFSLALRIALDAES